MSTHRCPAFECAAELTCRPHWFELPKELRDRIWHTYRARPYNAGKHTANVMEAIRYLQAEPVDESVEL